MTLHNTLAAIAVVAAFACLVTISTRYMAEPPPRIHHAPVRG